MYIKVPINIQITYVESFYDLVNMNAPNTASKTPKRQLASFSVNSRTGAVQAINIFYGHMSTCLMTKNLICPHIRLTKTL